jgi:hypothetical protein
MQQMAQASVLTRLGKSVLARVLRPNRLRIQDDSGGKIFGNHERRGSGLHR